ncbi:tetratricopeptide repeat protein [Candidatus Viadribacter manganicus]|nr:tetratricopeptide repeat protein [Candidatus Viadribacter manganicus]
MLKHRIIFAVVASAAFTLMAAPAMARTVDSNAAACANERDELPASVQADASTRFLRSFGVSRHDRAQAHKSRGNAYRALGRYELAIADYDAAIRVSPRYVEAYRNRARAYQDSGAINLATADSEEAGRISAAQQG